MSCGQRRPLRDSPTHLRRYPCRAGSVPLRLRLLGSVLAFAGATAPAVASPCVSLNPCAGPQDPVPQQQGTKTESIDALLQQAEAAARRGDAAEAARLFTAVAEARPHEPVLTVRAGEWLGAAGRLNDALAVLLEGREAFPEVAELGSLLARTLLLKAEANLAAGSGYDLDVVGYYEQAIEVCDEVLAVDPDARDAHLIRAQALFQLSRWDEARAAGEAAAARFPKHPGPAILLGTLAVAQCTDAVRRLREEDVDDAERELLVAERDRARDRARAALDRAVELDPQRAAPHRTLGELAVALGDLDGALSHFRRALALDPAVAVDHAWLTSEVSPGRRLELYRAALGEFDRAAGSSPQADRARGLLQWYIGKAHLDGGGFGAALAAFEHALALRPGEHSAHYYATIAAWRDGATGRAEHHAAAYAAANPAAFADTIRALPEGHRREVVDALRWLAAQARTGERSIPCRDINHVLAITLRTAEAWNNYALLCWEGGQYEEAYAGYLKALEVEPESPQLLNDAGAVLHHHLPTPANLALARDYYQRAIAAADAVLADPDADQDSRISARTARDNARANLAELK